MIRKDNDQPDINLIPTSAETFAEYYNKNIPEFFPHATIKILRKFQSAYPALFKRNDKWIIDKHRKKFMDWLTSYRETK